jgi:hypothetical protein
MQAIYDSIQLLERYKALSVAFQREKLFEEHNAEVVLGMLNGLGHDFSYNQKESFFGLKILEDEFEFRINISLKFGVVETIIWAKNLNTNQQYGGPISRMTKSIQVTNGSRQEKIPFPRFSTYADLEEFVRQLMSIFDDFKTAVKGSREFSSETS